MVIKPPWFSRGGFLLVVIGSEHMDADIHSHDIFYDHWLDLRPIERSSRLRSDDSMTT
jgi:hypothetical protein